MDDKSILTSNLRGRLGNQLFEVGVTLSLAKKYNMSPKFLKVKKDKKDKKDKTKTYWNEYIHNIELLSIEEYDNIKTKHKDKLKLNLNPNKSTVLTGFFQRHDLLNKAHIQKASRTLISFCLYKNVIPKLNCYISY